MILALLETDVACCTFHVDDDETVRAIENAEKQEERSQQHKSRKHATSGLLARGASSTILELNSRLCAASKKEYFKSSKGRTK
jgi:hypothetical protein